MLLALLFSFLAAVLARPIVARTAPHGGWVMAAVPAGLFFFFLSQGSALHGAAAIVDSVVWVPSLGVSLTLRLDGFSRLFALIITGIGTLVVVYSGAYFADATPRTSARFITFILLFMSAMLGAVLADDLIALFVFWEATSLLSFLLIGFHAERVQARKAALQSLIVTAGGGLALFAGFLLIGTALDTFSLAAVTARAGELTASPVAIPAMVLIIVGAFTKSAQVPFHFWLPAAMEAPTPASAYLHSATMVKLGVYLLARFDQVFADVPSFGTTLVAFGSLTLVVASVRALAAAGYKAVLAQSTVGSLGALVALIGLDGADAATATVAFILAHALYKATLFFCAGTAIHVTHEGRLSHLGGLRQLLPLTALAAALAAVSMAGLPPAFGFIAKEAVLEAQLSSGAGWLALGASLAGNAMFVAVAGVAGVRPFLGATVRPAASTGDDHHPASDAGREGTGGHGETAGLVIGPLALAFAAFAFGFSPWLVGSVVETATSSLLGRAETLHLSLWHGFTPALALSFLVVALGAVIFAAWDRVHRVLGRTPAVERLLGDDGYGVVFNGVQSLAAASTRILQNGDSHRYSRVVIGSVVALCGAGLVASGAPLRVGWSSGVFDPSSAIILMLMAIGAFAATRTRSLLKAMISIGVVGFGSALIYVLNGAPDLALTQFSVEVLVVVILTALLMRISPAGLTRERRERRFDAAISVAVGAVIFIALAGMVTLPLDRRLTDYFGATSYTEAHGRNVVNVIIVDYRGIDTLGEISVVAFATTAVWGLLRRRRGGARAD